MAGSDINEGDELVYDYGEKSKEATTVYPWLKE